METSEELRTPQDMRGIHGDESKRMRSTRPNQEESRGLSKISAPIIATVAIFVGLFTVKRFWRRQKEGSTSSLLEKGLKLPEPYSQTDAARLFGVRVVCAALIDIEGASTKHSEEGYSKKSADSIISLMDAGAVLIGRTITEELSLGLLGDREEAGNPAALECSVSGCGCGPAAVVASGQADVGLGTDHVSGIRVQSSIFGLSGFRPTCGELSGRGIAGVTGSLDTPAWLVSDPSLHLKLAETFNLPGGRAAFNNTELLQLVVASEVFELLGDAGRWLKAVAMSAAKKWAGPEQAASGLLITYLEKNVPAAKAFLGEEEKEGDILEAIQRAAAVLQHNALLQEHGHLLDDPSSLRADVLESLNNAQRVSEEDIAEAEQVAQETRQAMRTILKGVILILPSLPFPQPSQGSEQGDLKKWEKGALKLAALATLTGCPQASYAACVPREGKPPLGLSLYSMPKTDQRLAHVTARLAPLLKTAAIEKNAARSPKRDSGERKAARKELNNGQQEQLEAAKLAGNAAFKAGRYQEAIKQYSIGIDISGRKDPASCVLYSNRALCYIKVGLYQQAEEDSTAALQGGLNAKALLRRGTARSLMFKHQEAIQDFRHVLSLEPNNRQARKELENLLELGGDSFGHGNSSARSNLGTDRSSLA